MKNKEEIKEELIDQRKSYEQLLDAELFKQADICAGWIEALEFVLNEMCPVCGGSGIQVSEGMARANHPGIECGTCLGTGIRPEEAD